MKRVISILCTVAMLCLCFTACGVDKGDKTAETNQSVTSQSTNDAQDKQTVTMSITCESVFDYYDRLDENLKDSGVIPSDGIILKETEFEIEDDETVFDVLCRAVKDNKIQYDFQSAEESAFGSAYIKGIGNLYDNSCGDECGWIFTVNDESVDVGCSECKLKDGDSVEWIYVCSFSDYFGSAE